MNEVVVVGAGPGGATVAALLARAGVDVAVLEKDPFPRFHIGESLLPCDLPLFDRLGMDMVGQGFLHKAGAEFFDERSGDHARFHFSEGLPGTPGHAYQVERARFDAHVLDQAVREGARVEFGVRVAGVEADDDGVTVQTSQGPRRARYAIDATGQDALLGHVGRSIRGIEDFGLAAVFRHFDDLSDRVWAELADEGQGSIRILVVEDGWVWIIPLAGRRVSVGVVTRKKGVTLDLFDRTWAASPMLQRLSHGCPRTELRIIRNFSYRNVGSHGPRWSCLGDAALFLDPVFSSGVSLAMLSGERFADVLVPALRAGNEADPELARPVFDHMARAYTTFGSLIGAFYQTHILQNVFFAKDPDPAIRAGLISMLAGDVWRDDNPFQDMLLERKGRRFEPFAEGQGPKPVRGRD